MPGSKTKPLKMSDVFSDAVDAMQVFEEKETFGPYRKLQTLLMAGTLFGSIEPSPKGEQFLKELESDFKQLDVEKIGEAVNWWIEHAHHVGD